jgi:phosphoserine aminotransferase
MLNMRWIESQGGIRSLGDKNSLKSTLLYGEIDRNSLFEGFASKEDRSDMNATFNLIDTAHTEAFDSLCQTAGISGLKGHRSVGGYRASIYNAMSIESVEILVDCMQILEKKQ